MSNTSGQTKNQGLGWGYGRWRDMFENMDKQRIANRVKWLKANYPDESKTELANRVTQSAARSSAAAGVAMASPALIPILGLPLSILAVVPEELYIIKRNCEMILEIGGIYGFDPMEEERLFEIIAIAGNPSRTVESLIAAKEDIRRIAVRALVSLGNKTSTTVSLGVKAASKGFARHLPLIGLFASGGFNYFAQDRVGRKAALFYQELSKTQGHQLQKANCNDENQ